MLKLLGQFWRDREGNFAILTGLLIPLLLMAGGVALDFGLALSSSQRLTAAANGAVLAALSEVQARSDRGETYTGPMIEQTIRDFFGAASSNIAYTAVSSVTPKVTIENNRISASLAFRAQYDTAIMSVFGREQIALGDTAQAVVTLRSYINISILVDTSQSMGIGATDLDQQRVAQATGCAFACHINQARGKSSYDSARANGATMRIDVARSAVTAALDAIAEVREFDEQVTVGLYRFTNVMTEILSPTSPKASDLTYAKSQVASQIMLDMTLGGTNQEEALRQIANRTPASGTGRTASDRIQYVVVVTDGVESGQAWLPSYWFLHPLNSPNVPKQTYAAHEVNYALNPNICATLRSRGIEIFFIYTAYLEPKYGTISAHDKTRFGFITNSLFPIMPTRMATCTGKAANVLPANTPQEIHDTFVDLANRLSSPLRLY